MTSEEVERLALGALRAIEKGAPTFGALLGDVGGKVAAYLGPAAGLVADLIEQGHDVPATIAEIRSSAPEYAAAKARLRARARGRS